MIGRYAGGGWRSQPPKDAFEARKMSLCILQIKGRIRGFKTKVNHYHSLPQSALSRIYCIDFQFSRNWVAISYGGIAY